MTQTLTINGIDGFGTWGTDDLRPLGAIPKEFPVTSVSGTRTFNHGLENHDINARYKMTYDVIPYGTSITHQLNMLGTDSISYIKITPATITYTNDPTGAGTGIGITATQPFSVEMEFNIPAEQKSGSSAKQIQFILNAGTGYAVENLKIVALNSKWTLHQESRVLDDGTLLLNATGSFRQNTIIAPVLPNTNYTFVIRKDNTIGYYYFDELNANKADINSGILGTSGYPVGDVVRNIKTGANTYFLRIHLLNDTNIGVVNFTNPILSMGLNSIPYEKKRGDKMVIPVPRKNLLAINNYSINGAPAVISFDLYDGIKNGGTYTLSGMFAIFSDDLSTNDRVTLTFYYTDGTNNSTMSPVGGGIRDGVERFISITGTADKTKTLSRIKIWFFDYSTSNNFLHRTCRNLQLEEGSIYTAFEPMIVNTVAKPSRTTPSKNLLNLAALSTTPSGVAVAQHFVPLNLKPNTTYTIRSGINKGTDITSTNFYGWISNNINSNFDGNYVFHWNNGQGYTSTFTTDAGSKYYFLTYGNYKPLQEVMVNPQLEEGSTATAYEPYKPILSATTSGLILNGYTTYVENRVNMGTITNNNITVEMLVNLKSTIKSGTSPCLLTEIFTGGNLQFVIYFNGSSYLHAGFFSGGAFHEVVDTVAFPLNQWTKIYVTYNGLNIYVYFNDVLRMSAPLNLALPVGNGNGWRIGRRWDPSGYVDIIDGTIAYAKIWNNWNIVMDYDFRNPSTYAGNSILPQGTRGKLFNGTSDYLQLPSMMMDSIELDCLVDSYQPNPVPVLVDGRTGLSNGWFGLTTGSGWTSGTINGNAYSLQWADIPANQRIKLKLNAATYFTDNITLFDDYTAGNTTKGILYGVKCFLNGQVIYEQNYEYSPSQNLVPSFDDTRWNIFSTAKVTGRDTLHLNATGLWQNSTVTIPFGGNKTLKGFCKTTGYLHVYEYDASGNLLKSNYDLQAPTSLGITTQANTVNIQVLLGNNITGSFDFIKPQLYQLDGTEGTIYGNPVILQKPAVRNLTPIR